MRVYLQIEKRAIKAITLFEKKTDNINIPVGLEVRISDSQPQGPKLLKNFMNR